MLQVESERIPLTADDRGDLRVTGTRVGLECIVELFREGASPEEIAEGHDTLKLADVYAVLTFYLRHRKEVDDHLGRRKRADRKAQARVQAEFGAGSLRTRLLNAKRARRGGQV